MIRYRFQTLADSSNLCLLFWGFEIAILQRTWKVFGWRWNAEWTDKGTMNNWKPFELPIKRDLLKGFVPNNIRPAVNDVWPYQAALKTVLDKTLKLIGKVYGFPSMAFDMNFYTHNFRYTNMIHLASTLLDVWFEFLQCLLIILHVLLNIRVYVYSPTGAPLVMNAKFLSNSMHASKPSKTSPRAILDPPGTGNFQ